MGEKKKKGYLDIPCQEKPLMRLIYLTGKLFNFISDLICNTHD